ncbi:MAG: terminase large subunit domain-containing protein, partial [Nitrososphaerales archaeon]
AAFVPEDVITQVITPMLSTTDGSMIMISTPYDKSHFFYRAFNSTRWSKYQFKTEDNPLVKKEFLLAQREEVGELQFRQEYLAEFVDDEKTYFSMALLRS